MSLNPITREEKFLAKAGGEDVGELKPITRREQFLAKLAGGGSGGGGSWNDLKDKPFEETVEDITISFDCGNTEGLEFVEMMAGYGLYKISNLVPTKENLLGAAFISNMGNSDILAEDIEIRGDGNIQIFGSIFIVSDYNAISMPITSNGVWFNYSPSMQGIVFDLKYTARTIKTLDPKFLPAGVGGGGVMMVNVAYQDIAEGDSGMEFVGVSADKTHAEILGAINSGIFAVAILDMTLLGIGKMFLPLTGVMEYEGIANVAFSLQQGSEIFDVYVMAGDEWSAEITTAQ